MPDTGCFAVNAARLAGQAGLAFGWTPATFWALTPAELASVVAAHVELSGGAAAPPDAAARTALMEMFPDD